MSMDEYGYHAVENITTVYDLWATALHLLGLDHTQVIHMHKGRPERVDLNEGESIGDVIRGNA